MARFRVGLSGPDVCDDGVTPGFRVNVYDTTCPINSSAWECGADHFCVYAPTSTEAVEAAMALVADGTAASHFDRERRDDPAAWSVTA